MVNQESLVSISEASRILGVSEAALRQWTDEGRIKAFITPGGHRRYSRLELKRLIASAPQKMLGMKDLALKLEDSVQAHRDIGRSFLSTTLWDGKLSDESQKHLASLGRALLGLIVRYVSEPTKRKETINMAHEVGRDFGETLARLDFPLTDSVQAFLLHREPVMTMATNLMKRKEAFTDRLAGAIPMADRIIDEALVSLVAAHQQYRSTSQQENKGEVAE